MQKIEIHETVSGRHVTTYRVDAIAYRQENNAAYGGFVIAWVADGICVQQLHDGEWVTGVQLEDVRGLTVADLEARGFAREPGTYYDGTVVVKTVVD